MLKIRDELIIGLDKAIKRIDNENNLRNSRNDLVNIIQLLIDSNTLNERNNLSNFNENRNDISVDDKNISQDEIYDKNGNKSCSGKRASYITQNYEKFKQSQENNNVKKSEGKLINQSKILFFYFILF